MIQGESVLFCAYAWGVGILTVEPLQNDKNPTWGVHPAKWFESNHDLIVLLYLCRDLSGKESLQVIVKGSLYASSLFGNEALQRDFRPYRDRSSTPGTSMLVYKEITPATYEKAVDIANQVACALSRST